MVCKRCFVVAQEEIQFSSPENKGSKLNSEQAREEMRAGSKELIAPTFALTVADLRCPLGGANVAPPNTM